MEPISGKYGDVVTLRGPHMEKATSVAFQGAVDPGPISDAEDEVTAMVPMGATTGSVTVSTTEGDAVSPYGFVVLTSEEPESEPNDQKGSANEVPDGSWISGKISAGQDTDWFILKSGVGSIWAHTVEAELENQSNYDLHIEAMVKSTTMATTVVPPGTKERVWLTTLDNKNVYLKVFQPGPAAEDLEYVLQIGRVSLDDPGEPNDYPSLANQLQFGGQSWLEYGHYLAPAWDPVSLMGTGLVDVFKISGLSAGESIGVAVTVTPGGSAGLSSKLKVEMLDSNNVLIDVGLGSSLTDSYVDVGKNPLQPFHLGTGDFVLVRVTTESGTEPWAGVGGAPGRAKVPYRMTIVRN